MDEEMPTTLDALPFECLVEILCHLGTAPELCTVALTNHALHEVANADVLWRSLCVRSRHGQSLDFQNFLGSFHHPDAKVADEEGAAAPSETASGAASAKSATPWKDVYRLSRDTLQTTVCIDTGRGYAKYGMASGERPGHIQICMPGQEATQQSLYPIAFRRLGLHRRDVANHAVIVSEPFRLAAAENERERAIWRYETERRILEGFRFKQVCIVNSASLCLFAHNLTSGVVVNIGFANTFIVPVLRGHVIRGRAHRPRMGGMMLTQMFNEVLSMRGHDVLERSSASRRSPTSPSRATSKRPAARCTPRRSASSSGARASRASRERSARYSACPTPSRSA